MSEGSNPFPTGPLELPGEQERGHGRALHVKQKRRRKKPLLAVLVLIIMAALGFGVWKFVLSKDKPETSNVAVAPKPSEQDASPIADDSDVPEVTETKTFKSARPRVELKYPSSWAVSETEGGIRVTSPDFTYQNLAGEDVPGHFRIYIRQGAREQDSKYIGRCVAIQTSEKLVYAEPAVGQRTETNLSFFGLDTSDNFAFFFIAGNFSLKKDDVLGPDYGKEPETYIIAGGYSDKKLKEDLSMQQVSPDYFSSTRAYTQALDIIKSLKLI